MPTCLNRVLPLTLVLMTQLVANCAPERAKAIREDKSLTLGLPGASYRPNGKIGIGATFASVAGLKSKVTPDAAAGTTLVSTGSAERAVTTRETDIDPFVQFFPWDTSAFFVGVGGSYHMSKVKYDETREGSTNLAPSYTNVSYDRNSTYVGVPLGWAWIWQPGFSLTLDLGPRFRVSKSTAFNDDGVSDAVDQGQRDRTIKAIDSSEANVTLGGLLIGWSF